MNWANRPRI